MLFTHRQALRYMIRNTTLPNRVRAQAQLQLTQMHCYTHPTQITNRCIEAGKSRGILRAFRMSRVSPSSRSMARPSPVQMEANQGAHQFMFRMNALEGNIPGVKKASW